MRFVTLLLLSAMFAAPPASAEVISKTEQGFVVRLETSVNAGAAASWQVLAEPAKWWSSAHTFSGDAANMTIEMAAGGCFCEVLPPPKDTPSGPARGGVQHMRVVYFERGSMLRMVGALGPLQSEAVTGTLSIGLKPVAGGTRIVWEYIVSGYMRFKPEEIAPAVDGVLKLQLAGLAARIDLPKPTGTDRGATQPLVAPKGPAQPMKP